MPTPVSSAKQCLTSESAHALDEAVVIARRRAHAQTTSLHALYALLSLPSSTLRDACGRVHNSSFSSRLQLRALELCSSSSLDRLHSSQINVEDEPPISNSLMAAIKRSQANQRRNPESFYLHQHQQHLQQQQQQSSFSCVKVELKQLILSILDDPIVSRVFTESGFRSCDIKLAILRPRSRCPPLFLCNFSANDSGLLDRNENLKKIGEVFVRKKDRNPLLVGVYAKNVIRSFAEFVERGKVGIFPSEISGLRFICIEKVVLKFISGSESEGWLNSRFKELDQLMENCSGAGVVISFGDLKGFIDDNPMDSVIYVISQLTRMLEVYRGKLWLIGAVASYEMYLKFIMRFPSIEKDWDLYLLHINSVRPNSLMESFVPFGGFFSTPSYLKDPLSGTYQSFSRCHLCNEKYDQEVSVILKEGCTTSIVDHYQASLPSWLQTRHNTNKGLDMEKAKDDGTELNAKVSGLQKKWNDICRHLNHQYPISEASIYEIGTQVFPGIVSFPFIVDSKNKADDHNNSNIMNASPNKSGCEIIFPSMSIGLQKISIPNQKMTKTVVFEAKNENILSNSSIPNDHEPLSSEASVTTDLGLGTLFASIYKEPKKPTFQTHKERPSDFVDCVSPKFDVVQTNISNPLVRSSSYSGPEPNDFKTLWRGLTEKVGRQDEAIHAISQAIVRCRSWNERRRGTCLKRDIWFCFLGPDRVAKKKISMALAEIILGSRQNLIHVDLSSRDGIACSIFDCQEINGYDVKFRGKTIIDFIAEEITKKPFSVVFLENVDEADLLAQNSLSQAIKTGKLSDSHGREIGINNVIFVTTSRVSNNNKASSFDKEHVKFPEERILGVQGLQMQILLGYVTEDNIISNNSNVLVTLGKDTSGTRYVNKRKLIGACDAAQERQKTSRCLDLNLSIEEMEANDVDCGSNESESTSENLEFWLEGFFDQMDETIVFKPFNFDALHETLLKEISETFRKIIGSEGLLEIDSKVMEQILAAAWLSDGESAIEGWVEKVLGRSFAEARQRYPLTARTVMKLVTCEGLYMEEKGPWVCLPARIILN